MNQFLIPANSKKSLLIFSMFRPIDLIILVTGIGITLMMFFIFPPKELADTIFVLAPVGLAAFLVFPIANYHNTLVALISIYMFYTSRQKFIWKGWCTNDGIKEYEQKNKSK